MPPFSALTGVLSLHVCLSHFPSTQKRPFFSPSFCSSNLCLFCVSFLQSLLGFGNCRFSLVQSKSFTNPTWFLCWVLACFGSTDCVFHILRLKIRWVLGFELFSCRNNSFRSLS